MAEQIISASGPQYGMVVNADGSLNVSGVSATVTVGSEFYIPAGSVIVTSMPAVSVTTGSKVYPYLDSGGTYVAEPFKREVAISGTISTTPGSEVFMPAGSVIVTNTVAVSGEIGVTTGSESWIKNVVGVTPSGTFDVDTGLYVGSEAYVKNFSDLGSSVTQGTTPWIISGLISNLSEISVTAGSESWVKEMPKTEVYGSGTFNVTGEFATGSEVYVKNFEDLGSNVTQGTDPWIVLGSVAVTSDIEVTVGSESWIKNFEELGSTVVIDSPASIGSYTTQTVDGTVSVNVNSPEAVGSYAIQTIDATNLDIRDLTSVSDSVEVKQATQANLKSTVYQGTTPFVVLGSQYVSNPEEIGSLAVQTVDGNVTVTGIATAGSLAIQTVAGSVGIHNVIGVTPSGTFDVTASATNLDIRDLTSASDSVEVIGSVNINNASDVGGYAGSDVYVENFDELGSTVVIDSPSTIGSLAIQTIDGTVSTNVNNPETIGSFTGLYLGSEGWIKEIPNVTQTSTLRQLSAGSVIITNRIAGSIVNMPTTTVTATNLDIRDLTSASDSVEVIGSVNIDNAADVGGYPGSNLWVTPSGTFDVETNLSVGSEVWIPAGSVTITSMPDVNVTTGSESWIRGGSIQPYSQLGSVEVWQGTATDLVTNSNVTNFAELGSERTISAGSVIITNADEVGGYAGSLVVVDNFDDLGSNRVITNFDDLGSTVVIDSPASIGSYTTQTITATDLDIRNLSQLSDDVTVWQAGLDAPWVVTGSVQPYSQLGSVEIWQKTPADLVVSVDSPAAIGSYTTQTVDGTITVTGIETAGSLALQDVSIDTPEAVGSLAVQTVDGTVGVTNIATAGSLATQNVDGTISVDNFNDLGSSVVVKNFSDLGSTVVIDSPETIGSLAVQTVDGTITVTGISTAGSLAVQKVAGSVYSTGSINIISELNLKNIGTGFKQATGTASGTYTQAWGITGTGSRLEVHGFHISTDNPGYVRMLVSGTTKTEIADYNLNYASGATIEKTFVTPIVPGAADIQLGFGTTVAGSTLVTIYGREIK